MEKRFKLLKLFGLLFKVIAWVCLLLGIVGAVGVFVAGNSQAQGVPPRAVGIAVVLAAWSLFFLIFYTVSEVIGILLTIEENSRKN